MSLIEKRNLLLLVLTFFIGFVLVFIIWGFPLALIYTIFWIDKIIIGSFTPVRYLGIEFTTIATVLLGFLYEPLFGFLFTIIMLPLMHASKYIFLPLPQPQWPFFIPSPYNIIDAFAVLIASFLSSITFLHVVIIVVILKDIFYAIAEKTMIGKPIDVISAFTYLIFNIVIAFYLGDFLLNLTGL